MLPSAALRMQPQAQQNLPLSADGRSNSLDQQTRVETATKLSYQPREYLPVPRNDVNSSSFKLEQSTLAQSSELSLSEEDIRVVVFQQGEKHASPQPLFDSHRPIARPFEGSSTRTGRGRSSSARNIENDLPSAPGRRSSLSFTASHPQQQQLLLQQQQHLYHRSHGDATPSSRTADRESRRRHANSGSAGITRPRAPSTPSDSGGGASQPTIAQVLAASFSSLLSSPLRSLSSSASSDATDVPHPHPTTSHGKSTTSHHRPTSPTLSVASRCSTPRNPGPSLPLTNHWHELPASSTDLPDSRSASPATLAKNSDHKLLGEMIDSLPMRGCQASVKIHQLKNPSRVMMTYNFTMYVRKQGRGSPTSDDSFYMSSCSSYGPESTTSPLRSSTEFLTSGGSAHMRRAGSDQALVARSEMFTASCSDTRRRPSLLLANHRPPPLQPLAPHGNCTAHQAMPAAYSQPGSTGTTRPRPRGDSGARVLTPGAHTPASSVSSVGSSGYNSSHDQRMSGGDGVWSLDDDPVPMKALRFAVVILVDTPPENSSLNVFLHTHWPLIMRHMVRVRDGIEVAVSSKMFLKNSVAFLDSQRDLRRKITSLWRTPRIESPVWLTLSAFEYSRRQIGCGFIREFVRVAKDYASAGRDKFLPAVLTAVLSHHVGWVSSVKDGALRKALTESRLAYGGGADGGGVNVGVHVANGSAIQGADSTGPADVLNQQMSEVHGALCWPRHLARTVVAGQSADAVAVLLHLLTFFIRSSDVHDATSNLTRDCRDATGNFMRSRTPMPHPVSQTRAIPHSRQRDIVPTAATSTTTTAATTPATTAAAAATASKQSDSLRSPLPEESNMYQSNLDRFSAGDFTPTNFASLKSMQRRPSDSSTPSSSLGPASTTTAPKVRCLDLSLRPALSKAGSADRADSPLTPATVKSPSPPPSPMVTAARSTCAGGTAAMAIAGDAAVTATSPMTSLLSSSLRQHDDALAASKESIGREAHRRWAEWMASMKSVNMSSSPPGSPVGEEKSLSQAGCVFAPLHSNIARSLLGGLSSEYQSDFVLHGTSRPHNELVRHVNYDLQLAVQHSVLTCPVASAVCVVVNVDRWSCEVLSQSRPPPDVTTQALLGKQLLESRSPAEASHMVSELLTSVIGVWDLGMSELMCLLHLEDGLRQILLKCKMASEYCSRQPSYQLDQHHLRTMFGVGESDMELVMSINRALWSPN